MLKKIIEFLLSLFKPKQVPASNEPVDQIRVDAQQGWNNLVKIYSGATKIPLGLRVASLAQWILESGRGSSTLAEKHLNYAGMAYRPELANVATAVEVQTSDGLKVYAKFEGDQAFIDGYWKFIGRGIYSGYAKYGADPLGYIKFIKSKGYAQDKNYVEKVSAFFSEAEALLKSNEPRPVIKKDPVVSENPVGHESHIYSEPIIHMVDVKIKTQGFYKTVSGLPKGMVHHFTAGHLSVGDGGVMNMLKDLGSRGLGCMGMNEAGEIFVPKDIGFKVRSYHAGSSNWRGFNSMNQYLMGMEVCNPGKLIKYGDEFFAWFDCDAKEKPKAGAVAQDPMRVRSWTENKGKQSKGYYLAFTEAQEKALINFNLWQKKTNPEYDFDYCVGHDEISLSGKTDPGACLSMSMPEFRELLKRLAVNV